MRNLEQELKLGLGEREYNMLLALAKKQPALQTNYYFVAKEFSPDVMVRLREKNGSFFLGYKSRLSNQDGVSVCDERECEVTPSFAKSLVGRGILPAEINMMLSTDFAEAMHCVGMLQTYRTVFDHAEWHLELDKNLYLGKCDYELECECANVEQLGKLKNYLAYNFGIVIKYSKPKSQRFFEALKEQQKTAKQKIK